MEAEKKTKKKNTSPLESWEQAQVFRWARANQILWPDLQLLNGSLNGVRLRPKQWTEAKEQGVRKGHPDITLPVARGGYHGLYIELKRIKGGRVEPEQRRWMEKLNHGGYLAVVCYGHADAIDTIKRYLDTQK